MVLIDVRTGKGIYIGTFKACQPQGLGAWLDTGRTKMVAIPMSEIREALPVRWRKAFDRAIGFWIPKSYPQPEITGSARSGSYR